MKQRALRVLVCLALCFTLAGQAYATESSVEVPVYVNGVSIETGFASQVVNGQTYVSYNAIVNPTPWPSGPTIRRKSPPPA